MRVHMCPNCGRYFDSSSICLANDVHWWVVHTIEVREIAHLDLARLAVFRGQLVEEDTVLDDDPDSPTEGNYFKLYRSTSPEITKHEI